MRWIKTGKTVSAEGTTITYQEDKGDLVIVSRKRHIHHANGIGTWDYTSYWLLQRNKEIKEFHALKDAREYAEKYKEDNK